MNKRKKIIIIGTRRSGSTFIGKLLSVASNNFSYVEEPLNPVSGIKSLDHVWYPYIKEDYENTKVLVDLNKVLNLKWVPFKNSIVNIKTKKSYLNVSKMEVFVEIFKNESNEPLVKRILRFLFKNNHYISFIKAKFSNKPYVVFKDVLMSLSLNEVLKVKNTYIIYIFRSPLGFCHSIDRLNWTIDTKNFIKQKKLMKDYPFIKDLPCESKLDQIINEWLIVNKILLDNLKKGNPIICVSHSKLSLEPQSQLDKIFQKLSLKEKINYKKIENYTKGNYSSNLTKDVRRNSMKELKSWEGKISKKDQDYIIKRTRSVFEELKEYAI